MTSPPNPTPARSGLEIRPCRQDELRLLEWSGAYAEHRQIIEDTFARQVAGEALMLLAVADDFPVAQVWLDFERPAQPDTALLWALRTHPQVQGRGIGSRLVRRAEDIAARRGKRAVELGVEKQNVRARRFYERLGYARVGEVEETCRYRSPDGEEREWTVDQWKLRRKVIGPPARSAPRDAGSGCAGRSGTSRRGGSRR